MAAKYNLRKQTTEHLEAEIESFQNVCKKHHHSHPYWKIASAHLQPLFEEMARRQKAGLLS